jgi:hypothetical protein
MSKDKRMDANNIGAQNAEDRLLATLVIKCKECDARMSTGRQEGKRYYFCGNAMAHEDGLDRYVYVDMPEYLDWEFDSKLSSKQKTD